MNEAHLSAQHVCGLATEVGLLRHEIEKCLPLDMQDFRVGDGLRCKTISMAGVGCWDAQKRAGGEGPVELVSVFDRETDLALEDEVDAAIFFIYFK